MNRIHLRPYSIGAASRSLPWLCRRVQKRSYDSIAWIENLRLNRYSWESYMSFLWVVDPSLVNWVRIIKNWLINNLVKVKSSWDRWQTPLREEILSKDYCTLKRIVLLRSYAISALLTWFIIRLTSLRMQSLCISLSRDTLRKRESLSQRSFRKWKRLR